MYALLAAESQELSGQIGGTLRGTLNLFEIVVPRIFLIDARKQDFRESQNDLQKIVKVMRDTTCESSDGIHFQGLLELLLQFDFGRDVARDSDEAHDASVLIFDRRFRCGDPVDLSVCGSFLFDLGNKRLSGLEDVLFFGAADLGLLCGFEIVVAFADCVVGRFEPQRESMGLADFQETRLGVFEINPVGQVVHQRIEQIAFMNQCLVGTFLFLDRLNEVVSGRFGFIEQAACFFCRFLGLCLCPFSVGNIGKEAGNLMRKRLEGRAFKILVQCFRMEIVAESFAALKDMRVRGNQIRIIIGNNGQNRLSG